MGPGAGGASHSTIGDPRGEDVQTDGGSLLPQGGKVHLNHLPPTTLPLQHLEADRPQLKVGLPAPSRELAAQDCPPTLLCLSVREGEKRSAKEMLVQGGGGEESRAISREVCRGKKGL